MCVCNLTEEDSEFSDEYFLVCSGGNTVIFEAKSFLPVKIKEELLFLFGVYLDEEFGWRGLLGHRRGDRCDV